MKKEFIIKSLIFILVLIGIVIAADFTPQGDIDLRKVYAIKNATNITAEFYCNDTNCYTISQLSVDNDTTYSAGADINLTGTSFSHNDTSTQADSDNSGNTFIQDIFLDTYGHITSLVTAVVSITNIFDQSLNTTDNVVFNSVNATNWENVSITESQISDLFHTIDTSAYVNCSTDEVFLGNGSCRSSDDFYDDTTTVDTSSYVNCSTSEVFLGNGSCMDSDLFFSTYNSTYDNYAYNQSLATFDMWNDTWDNSFMNVWNYNQSEATRNMWNTTWSSTYNSTYETFAQDIYVNETGDTMTGNLVMQSNITLRDNEYICLGSSGCSDSYLYFNGSSLIIKVN